MNEVKIYTPQITPRLQYSAHIIFSVVLKTPFDIVSEKSEGITINYSDEEVDGALQIVPSGLLEQTGIASHDVKVGDLDGVKTLFYGQRGDLPFDIFSAVFYMCSRYEEYLPFEADVHNRFKVEDSLAFRNGFTGDPVVELWAQKLAQKLNIEYKTDGFEIQLTIDVDHAWKYRCKPFVKNKMGAIREFFTFKFSALGERLGVWLVGKTDPWDSYEYLNTLQTKLKKPIQYFFLMGRKKPYDRAVSVSRKPFRELIYNLQQKNKVGIHPSYASNVSEKKLTDEYYKLSKVVKNKPLRSRQHYLKLEFPKTFQQLILLGIIEDYSLGWAGKAGFRAGISRPFPFYDISKEKQTHLMFVPFAFMDRTVKDYMKLEKEEALTEIKALLDKTKAVGGHFSMLWHNDSVSDTGEWQGWRALLEEVVDYANAE